MLPTASNGIVGMSEIKLTEMIQIYNNKKRNAKQKGVYFNLTMEDCLDLVAEYPKCYYTGVNIHWGAKHHPHRATFERLNANKGYVKGNVVITAQRANNEKANLDAFLMNNNFTAEQKKFMLEEALSHLNAQVETIDNLRKGSLSFFSKNLKKVK